MIASHLLVLGFIMKVVAVLFVICSVALILIVLIQKGRGGGLSAAFGGGMASSLLGSKTGDFLTWVTIVLVTIFLTLAVLMAKFYRPTVSDYDVSRPAPKGPHSQSQPVETVPTPTQQPTTDEQAMPVPEADDVSDDTDVNLPGS